MLKRPDPLWKSMWFKFKACVMALVERECPQLPNDYFDNHGN